jgi:diadenosine tetraphosphatase ApaH/serine/threonine PP2A family protein phosphatase
VLALLADIHSNLEALQACLAHARAAGARRYALLGDVVGYGADPAAVVELAMGLVDDGALVVKGNHDAAIDGQAGYLNRSAAEAIEWTRRALGDAHRRFLAGLPLERREGNAAYAHGSLDQPARWTYIDGPDAAQRCMAAAGTTYAFCGHVHDPRLFFESGPGRAVAFRPTAGTSVPVSSHRHWLAIPGSVGQPRDGDTRAAYALVDFEGERITFHRVAYDHQGVADKMERSGLPAALVFRMRRGI